MTTTDNVVRMWRKRPELTRRQAYHCRQCGRMWLTKRIRCADCGAPQDSLVRSPMPATGTVLAATVAGAQIEQLDSLTTTTKAVLLELANGSNLACQVSDADAGYTLQLHGKQMYLTVRRMPAENFQPDSPIPYGLKAALDIKTRTELNSPPTNQG